jgi:hypothetical protein
MTNIIIPQIPGVPGNPIFIVGGFLIFYYAIAKPMLDYDLTKSLIIYAIFIFLYMKYGKSKFTVSAFGRRH